MSAKDYVPLPPALSPAGDGDQPRLEAGDAELDPDRVPRPRYLAGVVVPRGRWGRIAGTAEMRKRLLPG